jgi:DNA polymerase delta subunit 1
LINIDIGGASWIELPAGKYSLVDSDKRESNCTIEADIPYVNHQK